MSDTLNDDAALQARVQRIGAELRCLVCQNQTIADSNAPLAQDLRRELREQLLRGASDDEVLRFMTQRYGDFVRYRPPLAARTALLWAGPGLLLLGGAATLAWVLRRRSKLAPDCFEPDADDADDSVASAGGAAHSPQT